jgi:hypothetical protein
VTVQRGLDESHVLERVCRFPIPIVVTLPASERPHKIRHLEFDTLRRGFDDLLLLSRVSPMLVARYSVNGDTQAAGAVAERGVLNVEPAIGAGEGHAVVGLFAPGRDGRAKGELDEAVGAVGGGDGHVDRVVWLEMRLTERGVAREGGERAGEDNAESGDCMLGRMRLV